MTDAVAVEERSPARWAAALSLAMANGAPREEEAALFEQAVAEFPDYPPLYSRHLYYLLPRWHGEPGDWPRAVTAIAQMPGGKEKYARAVWSLERANALETDLVSWPLLKQGLAEMRARHPESFEIKSVSCKLAWHFGDRAETQARLQELGRRMDPAVWRDREQFAHAYHWATFEQGEVAGGDPLARFFAWVMGS